MIDFKTDLFEENTYSSPPSLAGAGKSTLFNALVGHRHRDSGEIIFNGRPFSKVDRWQTGYVVQEDVFYADLTLQQTLQVTKSSNSWTNILRVPCTCRATS